MPAIAGGRWFPASRSCWPPTDRTRCRIRRGGWGRVPKCRQRPPRRLRAVPFCAAGATSGASAGLRRNRRGNQRPSRDRRSVSRLPRSPRQSRPALFSPKRISIPSSAPWAGRARRPATERHRVSGAWKDRRGPSWLFVSPKACATRKPSTMDSACDKCWTKPDRWCARPRLPEYRQQRRRRRQRCRPFLPRCAGRLVRRGKQSHRRRSSPALLRRLPPESNRQSRRLVVRTAGWSSSFCLHEWETCLAWVRPASESRHRIRRKPRSACFRETSRTAARTKRIPRPGF
mmetsp:Transcript_22267/g.46920  ORF Transcript_22267/g.46920 Transcript_22267/m.46920 type:complete len:288 (-) Transcript_22267:513-1376(-)